MPKWNICLAPSSQSQSRAIEKLPQPFGYSLQITQLNVQAPKKIQMIKNKLFQMATAPKMQIFMIVFIIYFMIGNVVTIYSILAIFQSLYSTVSSLFKVNESFEPYKDMSKELLKYKLIYTALNLVSLGLIIVKLQKLGLLSFSPSSYIDLIPPFSGFNVIVQI